MSASGPNIFTRVRRFWYSIDRRHHKLEAVRYFMYISFPILVYKYTTAENMIWLRDTFGLGSVHPIPIQHNLEMEMPEVVSERERKRREKRAKIRDERIASNKAQLDTDNTVTQTVDQQTQGDTNPQPIQ
eukprot:TRINITY_DN6008_c0_g1_i2.p1 TRINITY_DN6008_c0_g1~~TRINITY_DN6008_c0_g1_i2.p1  ORF type:complete len:137 (+),score=11.60 TRINITY_DN6008_c0_g1_i2:24-413(+)